MLEGVCKLYTVLLKEEIEVIKKTSNLLPTLSELLGADMFIDCLTRDKNVAIVLAQSRPTKKTLYKRDIIGEFALRENEPAVLRTLETGLPTRKSKAITQEDMNVIQDVIPIKNSNNETIAVLIAEMAEGDSEHDNSKIFDKKTLKIIKDFRSFESKVTDFIKEGVVVFDHKGKVTYFNPVAKELYSKVGYKGDLLDEHFDNIVLTSFSFKNILEKINEKIEITHEINTSNYYLNIDYFINSKVEENFNVYMILRDITEEKKKSKELILKSVAIKEIHHRVKNSLQTTASLLRIQKRRVKDSETKKILEDSINRILSIAITHELLCENGFDNTNIKKIIQTLSSNFLRNYLDISQKVDITIDGDDFLVNSNNATSIALVINEIFQNIYDHAFKSRESGEIKIGLKEGPFFSKIIISDNGVGISEVNTLKEGLGLTIIKIIVKEKLKGNLKISKRKKMGTSIEFDFKNN
ncbi:MAG: histidine kinase N-terminal domain-containing protein [Fusobacteriaceae bacterium]